MTPRQTSPTENELKLEMSPMIDLVFLLLIFFMVSSHLIIVQIDKNVKPPDVEVGKIPDSSQGRILVNIHADGSIFGPDQRELMTSEEISSYVDEMRLQNRTVGLNSRLHIRADRSADTRNIKRVVEAAAAAKVENVIFATLEVNRN